LRTKKRTKTADPTMLKPQLTQASPIDTSAIMAMAPLLLLGRPARPLRSRLKIGVVARM